ncbi:hypothetical protein AB1Y20_007542 [Prymnesium parvum]|uniref:Protein kinase domain-containing protein n=1 Tax=Prymnesium parvum TaxID=97485 RepID=A0AB34IXZ2_PRYPA
MEADLQLADVESAYEMVDKFGVGASAAVYLAKRRADSQDVAIKVFDLSALEDTETADAVRTEVGLLRMTSHMHIVRLLEVVRDRKSLCVVMEALKGGELFAHLQKGAMPEEQTRTIFSQVVCAVDHLHSLGFVHRDVKPENIMYASPPADGSPIVKLVDFGSAARCDREGGGVTGLASTPHYVAPEVLHSAGYCDAPPTNEPYGQKCDVWSLGVLLFAMLSKTFPFAPRVVKKGMNKENEILRRVAQGAFDFIPNKNWLSVSSEAKDLIRKCLVLNPAQRISIGELKKDVWCRDAVAAAAEFAAKTAPAANAAPAAKEAVVEVQSKYLKRHCSALEDAISRAVSSAVLCAQSPSSDPRDRSVSSFVCGGMEADVQLDDVESAYEMVDKFGVGSSAAVYLATRRADSQDVAIKVFDLSALEDTETADAVRTEVGLLRMTSHMHIVRLLEVVRDRKSLCVVMEALKGGELFAHLQKGAMPEEQTRTIFSQVVCAVDHLHSLGFVHRDVKPENIMYASPPADGSPIVKLVDFGSAARCDREGGGVTGLASTPHYVAPEVLHSAGYCDAPPTNEPYGQKCDVWSLGVLLFAMLSKTFPFAPRVVKKGMNKENEILRRVAKGAFDFIPNKNWLSVSCEAKDLIRKCLVLNPAHRISIGELKQDVWCRDAVAAAAELAAKAAPSAKAAEMELRSKYMRRHCSALEDAIGRAVSSAALCEHMNTVEQALEHVGTTLSSGSFRTFVPLSELPATVAYDVDALRALEWELDFALKACVRSRSADPIAFLGQELLRVRSTR